MKSPRWKILLELNHRFSGVELSYWFNLFDSPVCKVTIEDGKYYLTACRFEKLTDNLEVLESAERLKTMMIAVAKIELDRDFQSIEPDKTRGSISSIIEPISNKQNWYPKPLAEYQFGPLPTFTILDKDGKPIIQERQERWYDFYLEQCDDWIDNTVMFKALVYFAEKTTPFTLWWAYETIENDEGSRDAVKKLDSLTRNELSLFTESLDRYDMEGHGRHAKDPKRNYNRPKMPLSEARTFLAARILKPWLVKKREIYRSLAEGKVHAKYFSSKLNI
jgi:hypothetical protein